MVRSIDEIVALHIGGLALELCKQVKKNEDLRERVLMLEQEVKVEREAAKQKEKG